MKGMLSRWFPKVADSTALREGAGGKPDQGAIYDGTVGWEDGLDHFDLDDTSGVALVKVTLFKGHNPTTDGEKTTGRARGTPILIRIDPTQDDIPPDGAQVVIAMPADRMLTPGGGVLLKVVRPDAKFIPIRKPGEKIQFGPASNFMRMHADGSVSIFTRTEDSDQGKSVYLQVRPDGFRIVHPHIKCTLDATGFHVNHSSGARVDLGAISGLPAPLDSLGSYATISAAMVRIEGSAIMLGSAAGVGTPVARSDQVILALAELLTAIQAVGVAMAAVAGAVPPPGNTAAVAAAGVLTTALVALSASLAATELLIPSTSTMVT
jgi:hypothetical protein